MRAPRIAVCAIAVATLVCGVGLLWRVSFPIATSRRAPISEQLGIMNEAMNRLPHPAAQHPALGAVLDSSQAGADPGLLKARALRQARQSIFFDETAYVRTLLDDDETIAELEHTLQRTDELLSLSDDEDLRRSRPAIVLDRMVVIDTLELIAASDAAESTAASEALGWIATGDLPTGLPRVATRVLAGEAYDALAALARVSAVEAFDVYGRIAATRRGPALRPALIAGLMDTGVPGREAEQLVDDAAGTVPEL